MSCCWSRSAVLKSVEQPPDPLPAIDVKALLETYEDDKEFVVELMDSCLATFPGYHESLQKSREYLQIAALAHALKGSAGNLGCSPLQVASSDLEVLAKSSDEKSFDKVQVVLYEIQRVLDSVKSDPIFREAQNDTDI